MRSSTTRESPIPEEPVVDEQQVSLEQRSGLEDLERRPRRASATRSTLVAPRDLQARSAP